MRTKIPVRRLVIGVDDPRIEAEDVIVLIYAGDAVDSIVDLPPARDGVLLCVVKADFSPGAVILRTAMGDAFSVFGADGFRLTSEQESVTMLGDGHRTWFKLAGDVLSIYFKERRPEK